MRWIALALAAALAMTGAAAAQPLPESVRSAGVTTAQWQTVQAEVRRAAAARGASEAALAAVAARVSANLVVNGRIDLGQVFASIDQRAQQVADLQTQLTAMERADDPAVAALLSQARAAIVGGDLERGDALLAQAAQSDLAGIARDRARLAARQTRAAQTIGERGRLAEASADDLGAAALYAQAAETAPESDTQMRWRFRVWQAWALRNRGERFGETPPLRESVRIYRDVALLLAPRETRPADWAGTQNDLGQVLRLLGESGDHQALSDAVAAFQAALTVSTRESDPATWGSIQYNLGNALEELGERSADDQVLRDSIETFYAALEVRTRAAGPMAWAETWGDLGVALKALGLRGDEQALHDAVAAFRTAQLVHTRSRSPTDWARHQNNMASALRALGERGDAQALQDSAAALRAALAVDTRERAPGHWAIEQYNLALTLRALVRQGDRAVLADALAAARGALEVFEQGENTFAADRARRLITELETM